MADYSGHWVGKPGGYASCHWVSVDWFKITPPVDWLVTHPEVSLGTFFDIRNWLLLLNSKIQTGYWFFHHIKNRLLVCTYVPKKYRLLIISVFNCQLYKWFGQYRTT